MYYRQAKLIKLSLNDSQWRSEDINSKEQDYSDSACVALYRKMEDKDEFDILYERKN